MPAILLDFENLSLNENFKIVADHITRIINRNGKNVLAYNHSNLLIYSRLEVEQQKKVLHDAKVYLESLESFDAVSATTHGPNISIKDDYKISLWSALKYFGLRPMSDLFSYLTQEKIVEVYNSQGIQIWRNFNFFEVCGYSIEEMFCYTWMERYERNDEILQQIFSIMSRFLAGENATIKCDIHNQIKELISTEKLTIDAHHEYVSPFYDKENRYAGFIVVSSAKVSSRPTHAAFRPAALASAEISESNLT